MDVMSTSDRDAKRGYFGALSRRVPPSISRSFREGEGCHMCLKFRLVRVERIRIMVEESFWIRIPWRVRRGRKKL